MASTPSAPPGHIIFINGVPNAGKTTLALALQVMLSDAYWHLSLDDFLRGYTEQHWRSPNGPSFTTMMLGYLHSLRQLALSGANIIAEAVITPGRLNTYLELFGDLDVLLVGLHVPLQEAQRRERQRTDRRSPYEVTARDVEWVHAHGVYDLELDTSRLTPEEAAQHVAALLVSPPSPTAFQQLLGQQNTGTVMPFDTTSRESAAAETPGRFDRDMGEHLAAIQRAVASIGMQPAFTVRPWTEDDFPTIQRLSAAEGWPTPTDRPAEALYAWQRSWPPLIAEADGAIAGFLRGISHGGVSTYIAEIFVVPEQRGQGLGKALLAVAQALSPGTRLDLLSTENSRSFYESVGFRSFPGYRRSWAEFEALLDDNSTP